MCDFMGGAKYSVQAFATKIDHRNHVYYDLYNI